jgi:hypothetical protein
MNTEVIDTVITSQSSRRTRIWELTASFHCPVIGVCMPLGVLRKLVLKCIDGKVSLDDFDIHGRAVRECKTRNPLSEAIQRSLDERYESVIRTFKGAKTASALSALWQAALASGDLSGALWAALSHPRCDEAIATQIYRDIHMAQHQAGAHARVDQVRLTTLNDENGLLTRELGRIQQRMTQWVADKTRELQVLQDALNQAAVERAAREAVIESMQRQLEQYRETDSARIERIELQQQLAAALREQRRLRRELFLSTSGSEWFGKSRAPVSLVGTQHVGAQLVAAPLVGTPLVGTQPADPVNTLTTLSEVAVAAEPATEAVSNSLEHKLVLCVGGRIGNLPKYRQTIERLGAQFHLDHCKRTGKQCVFVENPSASALAQRLEAL